MLLRDNRRSMVVLPLLPSRNETSILSPAIPRRYRTISIPSDQREGRRPGSRAFWSHCTNLGLIQKRSPPRGPGLCTIRRVFVSVPPLPPSTTQHHGATNPVNGKSHGRGLCVLLILYLSTVTLFSHTQPTRIPNPNPSPLVLASSPPFVPYLSIVV